MNNKTKRTIRECPLNNIYSIFIKTCVSTSCSLNSHHCFRFHTSLSSLLYSANWPFPLVSWLIMAAIRRSGTVQTPIYQPQMRKHSENKREARKVEQNGMDFYPPFNLYMQIDAVDNMFSVPLYIASQQGRVNNRRVLVVIVLVNI